MSKERSMRITAHEMPGMWVPKDEAYNSDGDASGRVEIKALAGIILL